MFRNTPIRIAILKIFSKIKNPLTTQELLSALKEKGLKANKTTIYRQLESLRTNYLINEVRFNDRNIRYELNKKNNHQNVNTYAPGAQKIKVEVNRRNFGSQYE